MASIGPLVLRARLDLKPWGGRRLGDYGFVLPENGLIGEALATAAEAIVEQGPFAGMELGSVIADDPRAAIGALGLAATGNRPIFPLLVKLIDAVQNLSIQVHPPDEVALAENDSLGKTEAWYVLAAQPGSALYLGLRSEITLADFAAAVHAGLPTVDLLRRLDAHPNTTYLIPAGTIHALGAGVMVYEVQQPSMVTYRLDDWGRLDANGQPRPMHIRQGLAVAELGSRPEAMPATELRSVAGRRHLLTACRYFALERIALTAGEELTIHAPDSPQIITSIRGTVLLSANDQTVTLRSGGTAALLATSPIGYLHATEPTVVLRTWVPDWFYDGARNPIG